LGEITIVGEQDQARALLVQAPHAVDAALIGVGDQINGARAALTALVGAEHPRRLVQNVIATRGPLRAQRRAIHFDRLLEGIDLCAQLGHGHAIYGDLALFDQDVTGTARGHAVIGKILVEPHQRVG
jgi:hypothetical protein